jgi:hypothetical protein
MTDTVALRVWIAVLRDGKPCHSMTDFCTSKLLFDAARYCAEGVTEWREFFEVTDREND